MLDNKLSKKAHSLFIYILSVPDLSELDIEHLHQASNMGVNTVKKYMRELETKGYLIRERARDSRGRWCKGTMKILKEIN